MYVLSVIILNTRSFLFRLVSADLVILFIFNYFDPTLIILGHILDSACLMSGMQCEHIESNARKHPELSVNPSQDNRE